MKLNWKYLETPTGNIHFALCRGDKLIQEYTDINYAYHREKDSKDEFESSIDLFLEDQKRITELRIENKYAERIIKTTNSGDFRKLQRDIIKKEEKKAAALSKKITSNNF